MLAFQPEPCVPTQAVPYSNAPRTGVASVPQATHTAGRKRSGWARVSQTIRGLGAAGPLRAAALRSPVAVPVQPRRRVSAGVGEGDAERVAAGLRRITFEESPLHKAAAVQIPDLSLNPTHSPHNERESSAALRIPRWATLQGEAEPTLAVDSVSQSGSKEASGVDLLSATDSSSGGPAADAFVDPSLDHSRPGYGDEDACSSTIPASSAAAARLGLAAIRAAAVSRQVSRQLSSLSSAQRSPRGGADLLWMGGHNEEAAATTLVHEGPKEGQKPAPSTRNAAAPSPLRRSTTALSAALGGLTGGLLAARSGGAAAAAAGAAAAADRVAQRTEAVRTRFGREHCFSTPCMTVCLFAGEDSRPISSRSLRSWASAVPHGCCATVRRGLLHARSHRPVFLPNQPWRRGWHG